MSTRCFSKELQQMKLTDNEILVITNIISFSVGMGVRAGIKFIITTTWNLIYRAIFGKEEK